MGLIQAMPPDKKEKWVGTLVNLRNARKKRIRLEASKAAEANRFRFGRTRQEKQADASQVTRLESILESHRIEKLEIEER